MVYGASTAWPLAHLPNPAAHGPASTALGDSLKAEHHTPRQRKPNGDGDDGGSRPLKLLLAGESVVLGDRTAFGQEAAAQSEAAQSEVAVKRRRVKLLAEKGETADPCAN